MQVSPRDAPPRHIREGEVMTRCSADHHPAKAKPLLMALKPTDGDGRSQRGQLERASWTQVRDIDNVSVVGHPKFFQKIWFNLCFSLFWIQNGWTGSTSLVFGKNCFELLSTESRSQMKINSLVIFGVQFHCMNQFFSDLCPLPSIALRVKLLNML